VLVVEDNKDAAHSLRLLLKVQGHEIRLAYTGPEGIRTSAEWRPDVVVSDIGLPGADGYEVARQVRRQPGMDRALLVALTGYGTEDDRRQSREAGFDYHLTKPADPDVLQELITTWESGRTSA
jgi:two-component system CheB/CheR fusion protein